MASFYLPPSDKALADSIAAASGGQVIVRPEARAIEVHGQRLAVTREMIRADVIASHGQETPALEDLYSVKWDMLKRNATGRLTETETTLTVEGATEPGEEPAQAAYVEAQVIERHAPITFTGLTWVPVLLIVFLPNIWWGIVLRVLAGIWLLVVFAGAFRVAGQFGAWLTLNALWFGLALISPRWLVYVFAFLIVTGFMTIYRKTRKEW